MPKIETELKTLYTQAYREIRKQLLDIMGRFEFSTDDTPSDRLAIANKYGRLDRLIEQATAALTAANRQGMSLVNQSFRNIYSARYNAVIAQMKASTDDEEAIAILAAIPAMTLAKGQKIVSRVDNPFKDRAMSSLKDRAVVKATMTQQITNGILTGLTVSAIIGGIRDFVNGDLNRAVRIGVTELGKSEAQASEDARNKATDSGLYLLAVWHSTHDDRTRTIPDSSEFEHLEMDGVTIPHGQFFMVPTKDGGVEPLSEPRAAEGSAGNIINCRCNSRSIVVTKAQFEFVEAEYAKGNYRPNWQSVE